MKEFFSLLFGLTIYIFVPLLLISALFFGARIAKRGWVRQSLLTVGTCLSVGMAVFLVTALPYFWALHLESEWMAGKPKTRAEMESYLSLYSTHEIRSTQSGWGRGHIMREGDKMIQYLILGSAPLEVVYDKNDQLIASYTSYE